MLEARHLKKVYKPKRGVPVNALDDVSVKLPDKGMVFILGKSGSGKSTLLNVLGGLDKYDSGDILIKGVSSKNFKQKHFDSYRNTYIGFIFQEYNILDEFSIGANIGLALELQGKKATSEKINSILAEVDLAGMGNRKPNELSGGQKQRVAIARALVKNPEIIMADEPTGALDSNTGRQVFDTLKKLSKEKLVVIVSHDREFSEQYADRIIELADGKIISDVECTGDDDNIPENEGLNFKENEIEIPEEYILTEGDMKAINDYLRAKHSNHKVRLGIVKHGKVNNFVPTDEGKIPSDDGKGFKLIKSRLPVKNAFKMGCSSLKHKPVRLVFTIILSVVAFSLFGLAMTVSSYNHVDTSLKSMKDSNIRYLSYSKGVCSNPDDSYKWFDTYNSFINDDDIKFLSEKTGAKFKGLLRLGGNSSPFSDTSKLNIGSNMQLYTTSTFTDEELNAYGYTVSGRLPSASNEIAISDLYFQMFKKAGYIAPEGGDAVQINSESDLIDKTIKVKPYMQNYGDIGAEETYTIVGIVNTGFDIERYKSVIFAPETQQQQGGFADNLVSMVLSNEYESAVKYGLAGTMFVSADKYQNSFNSIPEQSNWNNYFSYYANLQNPSTGEYCGDLNANYAVPAASYGDGRITFFDGREGLAKNIGEYEIIVSPRIVFNIMRQRLSQNSEDDSINKLIKDCPDSDSMFSEIYTVTNGRAPTGSELADFKRDNDYYRLNEYFNYVSDYGNKVSGSGNISAYSLINKMKTLTNNAISDEIPASFIMDENGNIYSGSNSGKSFTFVIAGYYDDAVLPSNMGGQPDSTVLSDTFLSQFTVVKPGRYLATVAPLPSSDSDIRSAIALTQEEYQNGTVKYYLKNSVSSTLDSVNELLTNMGKVFLYVGIGFAVFASLMMYNFIATSINYKKKEIGILRAIGSRSNDVFRIFFSESFVIALINFVISAVITLIVSFLINGILRNNYGLLITLLSFGPVQIASVFGVAVGVAFIASFLPVKRIAAKKPIDAIRDK